MKLEHVFAATNRQPKAVYWLADSFVLTCATSSLLMLQIDHRHLHRTVLVRNVHQKDINRISGDGELAKKTNFSMTEHF